MSIQIGDYVRNIKSDFIGRVTDLAVDTVIVERWIANFKLGQPDQIFGRKDKECGYMTTTVWDRSEVEVY